MNFYRSYTAKDDQPVPDVDTYFLGVDMRRDPGQLEPGIVAEAWNCRFNDGVCGPRFGMRLLAWAHKHTVGQDPGYIFPYGSVAGAAMFNDPITGFRWLVIATSEGVYRSRQGSTPSLVPMPGGEIIPARVRLIQTYNGMVMLRGVGFDPLVCADLDAGFTVLPAATNSPGNVPIPPGISGVYVKNRLLVIDARPDIAHVDTIFVSDFGAVFDVLEGSLSYNSFKINQGSADRLVSVYPFNDNTFIAAKGASVYAITNVSGTNEELAANAKLDQITGEYGCRAPESFVQVGSDVWFLGHKRGISSIRQTETNALQGVDVPVSRDIDRLIQRINWTYADQCVSSYHDNKVLFALPIDDSQINNCVLVYNTLTKHWSGADIGAAVNVRDWLKLEYAGAIRLAYISHDGFIYLHEDGFLDDLGSPTGLVTPASIETRLITRGYGGQIPGRKNFGRASVRVSTWWPTGSVSLHMDGVVEGRGLGPLGPFSRVVYRRPHGRRDWRPTNINDDFLAPHREDYSLILTTPEEMQTGDAGLLGELHQSIDKGWRLRGRGKYAQLEISTTQGRIELRDCGVEAYRGSPRDGAQS